MKLLAVIALLACSPRATTPTAIRCARACPAVEMLEPIAGDVLADCCTDASGNTWSSCAWDREGRWRP